MRDLAQIDCGFSPINLKNKKGYSGVNKSQNYADWEERAQMSRQPVWVNSWLLIYSF